MRGGGCNFDYQKGGGGKRQCCPQSTSSKLPNTDMANANKQNPIKRGRVLAQLGPLRINSGASLGPVQPSACRDSSHGQRAPRTGQRGHQWRRWNGGAMTFSASGKQGSRGCRRCLGFRFGRCCCCSDPGLSRRAPLRWRLRWAAVSVWLPHTPDCSSFWPAPAVNRLRAGSCPAVTSLRFVRGGCGPQGDAAAKHWPGGPLPLSPLEIRSPWDPTAKTIRDAPRLRRCNASSCGVAFTCECE